ncbi:M91 family zinc metallopeptidase [Thiotrichales bacterium 19X7-9]|nr:M91 family zinc metallopeptidase [Thiotrichales bacterium 19X7-9]
MPKRSQVRHKSQQVIEPLGQKDRAGNIAYEVYPSFMTLTREDNEYTYILLAKEAMNQIASKANGKELVTQLQQSGYKVFIKRQGTEHHVLNVEKISSSNSIINADITYTNKVEVNKHFSSKKVITVCWNPNHIHAEGGIERPPFIGLAHELIHAWHIINGDSFEEHRSEELATVGLLEFEKSRNINENKIRQEHNLPFRTSYKPYTDEDYIHRTQSMYSESLGHAVQSTSSNLQEQIHLQLKIDDSLPVDTSFLDSINTSLHLEEFRYKIDYLKFKYSHLNELFSLGCRINNADTLESAKTIARQLISPNFVKKMISLANGVGVSHIGDTANISVKANALYIRLLKSLIDEGKLEGMEVFEALTMKKHTDRKFHKKNLVDGYLFRVAGILVSDIELSYSIVELLDSISEGDSEKASFIRNTLLAADSYSSSQFQRALGYRTYHDFYGRILYKGKEKHLTDAAKIAGAMLLEKDLMPHEDEIKKISKKRSEKYSLGAAVSAQFIETAEGKRSLNFLNSKGDCTLYEVVNELRGWLLLPDIEVCMKSEYEVLDKLEKKQRIANEWSKMRYEVVEDIVERTWREEMSKVHKKLSPGLLDMFLDLERATILQDQANKLPMDPPRSVIDDVMRELKSQSSVRDYIEKKALAGHPAQSIETQLSDQSYSQLSLMIDHVVDKQVGNRTVIVATQAAEEASSRIAEEQSRKLAEEQSRKLAEEQSKRLAEEQSKRLAEEQSKRLAEEQSKRLAEEQSKRLAEEQSRRLAEEQSRRLAEEQSRRAAQEAAGRAVDREIEIRLQMLRAPEPVSEALPVPTPMAHQHALRQREAEYLNEDGKPRIATIYG